MSNYRRRSVLYIPASNERAMEKGADLPVDAIILDLEDAVAPARKLEAREKTRIALEAGLFTDKEVIVRVNGASETNEWMAEDLAAIMPVAPNAVLFPKIRDREDALACEEALMHHYAPEGLKLWLMIETPQAILNLAEIASLNKNGEKRVDCFVMGTNDLSKEMRLPHTPSRLALLHALSACVMAARGYGMDCLDGVYGNINDEAGFEAECLQGKGLGFDGKTLIHPNQITLANRLFSPSEAEIIEARAIVAAFEAAENAGKGVLSVDGKMVEELHYRMAQRVLELVAF